LKIRKYFLLVIFSALTIVTAVFLLDLGRQGSITHPQYPDRFGIRVEAKESHYDLLLITVDTLRPDYLSHNGYDLDTSPWINKLIEEGLHFPKAITPIPRTTQALASLLTGCYPFETKVRYLWDTLSLEKVTLAEILQRLDYRNIAVVSNHVLPPKED
jgi:arylsulfatase A-like enzyme